MIEADRVKLKKVLDDVSNMMTMMESERSAINEAISEASKLFNIDKKVLRKIARTYHKQNFNDEVATNETFVEVYEQLTKG
jgi:hypothetical protein